MPYGAVRTDAVVTAKSVPERPASMESDRFGVVGASICTMAVHDGMKGLVYAVCVHGLTSQVFGPYSRKQTKDSAVMHGLFCSDDVDCSSCKKLTSQVFKRSARKKSMDSTDCTAMLALTPQCA